MRAAFESREKDNVQTVFEEALGVVEGKPLIPIAKRGHVQHVPDRAGHLVAAHEWGKLYMEAFEKVRRKDLYGDASAPPPPTTMPPHATIARPQQQAAYVRGYTLWYLCGRPVVPETPGDAKGERNDLWQYTVTSDNPEGSKTFDKTPSGLYDLRRRAIDAFDFHMQALKAQRIATAIAGATGSTSSTSSASSAPAAQASSSSSNRAGKRPASHEEARVATTPKHHSPPNEAAIVQHDSMYVAMNGSRIKKTKGFLQDPAKRHAFPTYPFDKIATRVDELMRAGAVIGWVPNPNNPKKRNIEALKLVLDEGKPPLLGNDIYTRLRMAHKMNDIYDDRGNLIPDGEWPDQFKVLGLQRVDSGTYNTVWRFGAARDGEPVPDGAALRAALSSELADPLIDGTHVLRMPKPDTHRTHADVSAEVAIVFEASRGGYGTQVLAPWGGRAEQPVPGDGSADAFYKLFMVVERGSKSALARLGDLALADKANKRTDADAWYHYFLQLRSCIWCFSANRCVHLDSKPGNFVDTFVDRISSDEKGKGVRVIDLDGRYYDRIERLRPEEVDPARAIDATTAMGWMPCWLYNVLYMCCNLRMQLEEGVYMDYWWKPISNAVHQTMLTVMRDTAYDEEYARARSFLVSDPALWQGVFFMTRPLLSPPPGVKGPEQLAQISVNMAKHYFHDTWWQEATKKLLPAAKRMMHSSNEYQWARTQGRPPHTLDEKEADWNAQKRACADAWTWFDYHFRPRGLPLIRFFETELRNDIAAKPLIEVMYMFAQKTDMDLYPYTHGAADPRRRLNNNLLTKGSYAKKDADVHAKWPNKVPRVYEYEWVKRWDWQSDEQAKEALGFGQLATV